MLKEIIFNLCGANRCRVLFYSAGGDSMYREDFVCAVTDGRIILSPGIVSCLRSGPFSDE